MYNILIVDDEVVILNTLKSFFDMKEGINITTTTNPIEALKMVKSIKYHIVLLDIQMPEMNGLEVLKRLKRIDPLIQVVIMTAFSSLERTIFALEYGASDYLMKPFRSLEEVWETLERIMKKLDRWKKIMKDSI